MPDPSAGLKRPTIEDDLIEYGPVIDVFCDGLGAIEQHPGGNIEFVLFRWTRIDGRLRRMIVARIFRPAAGLDEAVSLTMQARMDAMQAPELRVAAAN